MSEQFYLVWSNEHGSWWRAHHNGYSRQIDHAGRYSLKEATAICHNANRYLPELAERNEVLVLAPESLPKELDSA